jgi:hypothetical protein
MPGLKTLCKRTQTIGGHQCLAHDEPHDLGFGVVELRET